MCDAPWRQENSATGVEFEVDTPLPETTRPRGTRLGAFIILGVHTLLLAAGACLDSATYDELGHLPAGLSHWHFGNFDPYRVNPPLVRMLATLPLLIHGPNMDWEVSYASLVDRPEFMLAGKMVERNAERVQFYFTLARCACIPLSLLGAWICHRWAFRLYGSAAGLLAMSVWCFSPTVLGHGHLITPDVGAAALGAAALYLFWRWIKKPTWEHAFLTGLVLGLAELTKTTWILLFGLLPTLWFVWRWTEGRANSWIRWRNEAGQLGLTLVLALYVINSGYGFEGSFQRLGQYQFVSRTFSGTDVVSQDMPPSGNAFRNTCLASVPVPLPKSYLLGIDRQKRDFEKKMSSYLRGEWRHGGWWYYYLYALGVKVPLGMWILLLLAVFGVIFLRGYVANWRDEMVLVAPIASVLVLVSSQTGFNHHMRYVLPIFPYAFIWMSKVAKSLEFAHRKVAMLAVGALLWSLGSTLYCYPHCLSYFNELVGGPKGGHYHLLHSNIDWGQDLLYLKHWADNHPRAQPLYVATSVPIVDPSLVGIESSPPPSEPFPGWYALSVNKIHSQGGEYHFFLRFEPVAMAGYSIYIYHITLDEANRVRGELGLPEFNGMEG